MLHKNTWKWDVYVQLIARQHGKMNSKDNAISSAVIEPLH